jgi:hypothetical protein
MINYTDRLTVLMQDVVARVPTLSFIDMADVLVFGRFGRADAEGAFATCHCLSMPASEPGYYFWRDRATGLITRRSEWFVTKSPAVTLNGHSVKYLISFTLPRFCDQSLGRSRKERFYRRSTDAWVAKLDTVIHELYHIDPEQKGIRRIEREDGTCSAHSHGPQFLAQVAQMVSEYLDTDPDPAVYDFLPHDFDALERLCGGVTGTSFRRFPSYPQRFQERLGVQPVCGAEVASVAVEPWRDATPRASYTERDLHVRQFLRGTSRKLDTRSREIRAA